MKMKLTIVTAALIACGTAGLIAWSNRPSDEGEIKREKADRIMCQAYGKDWFRVLVASEKTNRTRMQAMVTAYESAIGYHKPGNRR
jgi:hypothetical protein